MYPVRLGFKKACLRISRLMGGGHEAEAVVAVAATAEKTFRRVLKQLVVSAGFTSKDADRLMVHFRGLEQTKKVWPLFDPEHRALPDIVGNGGWQRLKRAAEVRNGLVHGRDVPSKAKAKIIATDALDALQSARDALLKLYGYDGWTRVSVRRTSRLHADPLVKAGNPS